MTHINNPDQPPQGNLADITWTPATGIMITRMLLECGCIAEPGEPTDEGEPTWTVTQFCGKHQADRYRSWLQALASTINQTLLPDEPLRAAHIQEALSFLGLRLEDDRLDRPRDPVLEQEC